MQEIWKDILGYEGLYQVSNTGKVISYSKNPNGKLLIPYLTKGYQSVSLTKKPIGRKTFLVHRLVAQAFLPNPQNLKEINHKDENKQNNNVCNLEWCTREYNMCYKNARFHQGISHGVAVKQILVDVQVATYCSAEFAAKVNNIDESSILKCCNGKRKTAGGYMWEYA